MSDRPLAPVGPWSTAWWGIGWGVAVGIVEYLAVAPIDDWGSVRPLVFWLLYWTMPYWCLVGCLFVALADRYDQFIRRSQFVGVFLLLCAISAALQPVLSIALVRMTSLVFPDWVQSATDRGRSEWSGWTTLSVYQLWETSFYGTLLVSARILAQRGERTRHLLYQRAMARSRTEGLLDAARLQALQSQIEPRLLFDSMSELEQRYRTSPESAERLLESLVDFLRHATHGLRVPVSTLGAELRLARAYAQLQQERGSAGAWQVSDDSSDLASAFRFPSLLVLPLMALAADDGHPTLRVRTNGTRAVLALRGLSGQPSSLLRHQARLRLGALYGQRFSLKSNSLRPDRITIALHLPTSNQGEALEPRYTG
jgi:signal transduction histidine kinase